MVGKSLYVVMHVCIDNIIPFAAISSSQVPCSLTTHRWCCPISVVGGLDGHSRSGCMCKVHCHVCSRLPSPLGMPIERGCLWVIFSTLLHEGCRPPLTAEPGSHCMIGFWRAIDAHSIVRHHPPHHASIGHTKGSELCSPWMPPEERLHTHFAPFCSPVFPVFLVTREQPKTKRQKTQEERTSSLRQPGSAAGLCPGPPIPTRPRAAPSNTG